MRTKWRPDELCAEAEAQYDIFRYPVAGNEPSLREVSPCLDTRIQLVLVSLLVDMGRGGTDHKQGALRIFKNWLWLCFASYLM